MQVGLLIDSFALAGALFALWKGGTPERATALAVIANVVVSQACSRLVVDADGYFRLANDGATAVVLLVVTVRYAAPWMGGVMLFYAAQFSLHAFYLVTERPPHDYAHALINNIDFSGVTWCLILGTAVAWRGRHRQARG